MNISKLINIANYYDKINKPKLADRIDTLIKFAVENKRMQTTNSLIKKFGPGLQSFHNFWTSTQVTQLWDSFRIVYEKILEMIEDKRGAVKVIWKDDSAGLPQYINIPKDIKDRLDEVESDMQRYTIVGDWLREKGDFEVFEFIDDNPENSYHKNGVYSKTELKNAEKDVRKLLNTTERNDMPAYYDSSTPEEKAKQEKAMKEYVQHDEYQEYLDRKREQKRLEEEKNKPANPSYSDLFGTLEID